jgi:single-stranded DNA-binding protein
MDLNLIVLNGMLAADPELKVHQNGVSVARLLVTVRTAEPKRRIDVLPVVWENPDPDMYDRLSVGCGVWATGSCQRRFWSQEDGRRSVVEIIADQVVVRPIEETK